MLYILGSRFRLFYLHPARRSFGNGLWDWEEKGGRSIECEQGQYGHFGSESHHIKTKLNSDRAKSSERASIGQVLVCVADLFVFASCFWA